MAALCCLEIALLLHSFDGLPVLLHSAVLPLRQQQVLLQSKMAMASAYYAVGTCLVQHIADNLSQHHLCFHLSTEHVSLGLICHCGLQAGWQGCIGVADTGSLEDLADKVMLLFCAGLHTSNTMQQGHGKQLKGDSTCTV